MIFFNYIIKSIRFLLILLQGLLQGSAMDLPPYMASEVSEKILTTLYREEQELYFYLPEESISALKELLNNNEFCPIYREIFSCTEDCLDPKEIQVWSDQNWQDIHYRLMFGAKDETELSLCKELSKDGVLKYTKSKGLSADNPDHLGDLEDLLTLHKKYQLFSEHKRSLSDVSTLLSDAKAVIKSFIVLNDNGIDYDKNFIQKSRNLNRLFTYAKLHQEIIDQSLSCIRLPRKIIRFKNINTNKYISGEEVQQVIDKGLKICLHHDATFSIKFVLDGYKFDIFATLEKKERKYLSQQAGMQLRKLFEKAPFDIGSDNIFCDKNGNAIIIDTEYKGTELKDIHKLNRYPVDNNL